ncbi:hypothetical protein VP01_7533g1, partial [Puccinia sorghi]
EQVQRRLYNVNLILRLQDGSSLLLDSKEIRDAERAKFDMMELIEETLGSAPQAVQPLGGLGQVQDEVTSLADAVKELCLFVQRSEEGPL